MHRQSDSHRIDHLRRGLPVLATTAEETTLTESVPSARETSGEQERRPTLGSRMRGPSPSTHPTVREPQTSGSAESPALGDDVAYLSSANAASLEDDPQLPRVSLQMRHCPNRDGGYQQLYTEQSGAHPARSR